MTAFAPDNHYMLFMTALTDNETFAEFHAQTEGIWATDAFYSMLHATNLFNTTISDTAPADTNSVWIDPNNPAIGAPSVARIYNTATSAWETATLSLFADLLARVGAYNPDITWTTALRPATPSIGQAGYNVTIPSYEFWNGTAWEVFGNAGATHSAGSAAHALPVIGDTWFDTDDDILYQRLFDGLSTIWLQIS